MAMDMQQIGGWAFIGGVLIAILAGLVTGLGMTIPGLIALVLVVLGVVVGFLNINDKEMDKFLIAAIALMAAGTAGLVQIDSVVAPLGTILQNMVSNIAIFVAPAALVVALKAVHKLGSIKGMPLSPQ